MITVLTAGPLATVQDRGRAGFAHLGVPRGGPLDDIAADLANRLVGNDLDAALLEVTLGGLAVRAGTGRWVAVTGAICPTTVDGAPAAHDQPLWLAKGAELRLGTPETGVRSYLAVAGGISVEPVLGSRATDTLAGVGPPQVTDGVELPVGEPVGAPRAHDTPRPPTPGPLRVSPGPRETWFAEGTLRELCAAPYTVEADSNRIGLRLAGPPLARRPGGGEAPPHELPSEGMVLGAVQVPPSGQPVVFLADHPPTGGYPVIGVVRREDLWQCGQLRPGDAVRFTMDPAPGPAPGPGARR